MNGSSDTFWITGQFDCSAHDYGTSYGSSTFRYYDVRFEPSDVQAVIANVTPPNNPPEIQGTTEASTNKGGAPRKEWWDDFWIAICGQIYVGDFKPKSQAELERAMLDWASTHGHDMSDTSAKVAARRLFKAWKLGDKN